MALMQAYERGPAQVRVAAERACVGLAVARYTASRMVDSGELAVLVPGKPAVLGLPGAGCVDLNAARPPMGDVVHALGLLQSFWERPPDV